MSSHDDTPVMYSPEEMGRIRAMLDMQDGQVLCPPVLDILYNSKIRVLYKIFCFIHSGLNAYL